MKTIGLISLLLVIISSILLYYFSGYKSAFEADQECHSILNTEYSEKLEYGCDHDLETRQWLLFEKGFENQPAIVIKRFRY